MTIGERAAQAIRNRREVLGTLSAAFKEINLTRDVFDGWDKKDRNPSAYWLQQMALAGYDTHWILTGFEGIPGDIVRCKDCKYFSDCFQYCKLHSSDPKSYNTDCVSMCPDDFCSYGERKTDEKKD